MTLEDLQSGWASEKAEDQAEVDAQRVLTLCRKTGRVSNKLIRRNVVETVAAGVVAFWFGRDLLGDDNLLTKAVAGFIVLWAVFVVARLWLARRIDPLANAGESMAAYFVGELKRMDAEVRMLKSVLYWYILPCLVACNLYFWATGAPVWMSAIYLICTAVFGGWLYVINQRAADQKLGPVRDELSRMVEELESIEAEAA